MRGAAYFTAIEHEVVEAPGHQVVGGIQAGGLPLEFGRELCMQKLLKGLQFFE